MKSNVTLTVPAASAYPGPMPMQNCADTWPCLSGVDHGVLAGLTRLVDNKTGKGRFGVKAAAKKSHYKYAATATAIQALARTGFCTVVPASKQEQIENDAVSDYTLHPPPPHPAKGCEECAAAAAVTSSRREAQVKSKPGTSSRPSKVVPVVAPVDTFEAYTKTLARTDLVRPPTRAASDRLAELQGLGGDEHYGARSRFHRDQLDAWQENLAAKRAANPAWAAKVDAKRDEKMKREAAKSDVQYRAQIAAYKVSCANAPKVIAEVDEDDAPLDAEAEAQERAAFTWRPVWAGGPDDDDAEVEPAAAMH